MARNNQGINVLSNLDPVPTDLQGGYAGGDSTAAAMALAGGQAQAALTTMENLKVAVNPLPSTSGPTIAISGTVPQRTITIGVPEGKPGKDGMGYAQGQQLLADSAAVKTDSAQVKAESANILTLAQQAQKAALEVPGEAIDSVQSNPESDSVKKRGTLSPATIDHAGVQAALTSAASFGLRVQAAGAYTTDQTLTIGADCDLSGLTITYTGSGVAVSVPSASKKTMVLPYVVHGGKTQNGWAQVAGTVGYRIANQARTAVTLSGAQSFETGAQLVGEGGEHAYCTYTVGALINNKINLHVHTINSGWVNENVWIGGRCAHYSNEAAGGAGAAMTGPAPGTRHILMTAASSTFGGPNGNKFLGISLENTGATEYQVDMDNGSNNLFLSCRWEAWFGGSATASGAYPRVRVGAKGGNGNIIEGGYDAHRIVQTIDPAGVPLQIRSTYGTRQEFANTAASGGRAAVRGGNVWSNASGGTAPVWAVMRPNWERLGDDPATAWTWQVTQLAFSGKRYNEAFPRVEFDASGGTIALGSGTAAPLKIYGGTNGFFADGTWMPWVDATYDTGATTRRWRDVFASRYVRVGTAVVTGSDTTANRPTAATAGRGAMFFDATLGRPIWSNGTAWVDATGATV